MNTMKILDITFNLSTFIAIIVLAYLIVDSVKTNISIKRIHRMIKSKPKIESGKKIYEFRIFKTLYQNLSILLKDKNKTKYIKHYFYVIIGFILLSMGFLFYQKQILLGLLTPIILIKFINKLIFLSQNNIQQQIEEELPTTIDNIIRVSTKYDDIKTIIFQTSQVINDPLKTIFQDISRKMITENCDKVLMNCAYKYDNVWFYNFIFILMSYLENSNKENTVKNLRDLRNMLEKENSIRKTDKTKKKGGVVLNRAVCAIGIIGFFIVMSVLPNAKEFFFSTFAGITCFLVGFGCMMLTIFINVLLTKSNKKNK